MRLDKLVEMIKSIGRQKQNGFFGQLTKEQAQLLGLNEMGPGDVTNATPLSKPRAAARPVVGAQRTPASPSPQVRNPVPSTSNAAPGPTTPRSVTPITPAAPRQAVSPAPITNRQQLANRLGYQPAKIDEPRNTNYDKDLPPSVKKDTVPNIPSPAIKFDAERAARSSGDPVGDATKETGKSRTFDRVGGGGEYGEGHGTQIAHVDGGINNIKPSVTGTPGAVGSPGRNADTPAPNQSTPAAAPAIPAKVPQKSAPERSASSSGGGSSGGQPSWAQKAFNPDTGG